MKLNTSIRKRFRVSNKVKRVATNDRFRLSISRSAKNISAQIIDDIKKVTLLSASSVEKDLKSAEKINKTELSKLVAKKLAKIKVKTNKNYHFEYKEIGLKPGEKLKETLKDKNEILKKVSTE